MKFFFTILCLLFLNACVQSTAYIGPAITVATTGNVYQAGFAFGSGHVIKKETGKRPAEFVSEILEPNYKKKKFEEKFAELIENRIQATRQKILKNKN